MAQLKGIASVEAIPKQVLSIFRSSLVEGFTRSFEEIKNTMMSSLPSSLYASLYQFQIEGIARALQKDGRVMLADDMGLGKSIQALGIACCYRQSWPLLIIAPASMVANWAEQVLRWIPQVTSEDIAVAFDSKTPLDKLVNVVSYELAVKLVTVESSFQMIIADESHALKNHESKRSRTLVPVLKAASKVVLLSGTPALSRPLELFPQIQAVRPDLFPNIYEFGKRYCDGKMSPFGWDFKGASNLRELQWVLEQTIMIRRTKDEVMKQLPQKIRHQIYLKLSPSKLKAFKDFHRGINIPNPEDVDGSLEGFQRKSEYMALYKKSSECKLEAVLEYVMDLLENVGKILIFAHHQSVLDGLQDALEKKSIGLIRIDGKTDTSCRQQLCTHF